jgi:hypothetical protein
MTQDPIEPASSEREMPLVPALITVMMVSLLAITALFFLGPVGSHIQCDGMVPTWMIEAQDYDGGACAELLRTGDTPSNADWTPYCLGYCLNQDPDP